MYIQFKLLWEKQLNAILLTRILLLINLLLYDFQNINHIQPLLWYLIFNRYLFLVIKLLAKGIGLLIQTSTFD